MFASLPTTIDSATIPAAFAQVRVTQIKVDSSGVDINIRTGEKIRTVTITPRQQIKVDALNGSLCSGSESCSGTAPTILHLYRIPRLKLQNAIPRADGGSSITVVTNSGNIYRFDAVPGTAQKRLLNIVR